MKSIEPDIKPTILANDIPDESPSTLPTVSKFKHSRYEDVWPEDVHAAFMEAVALYPPMGKRRLKYYRVSPHENEHSSRAKSFGRCQLIQSYILEKTGINRSRKQVSSHLQRLKKIHRDNPALQPLFSERSQLSAERCPEPQATSPQDSFAEGPVGIKSDPDLIVDLHDMDSGVTGSPTFTGYASEAPSLNDPYNTPNLSANFHDQPSFPSALEFHSSVPQQCPAVALHSSDSDYLPELQDVLLFKDAVNEDFRSGSALNTSAFSTSMRRLTSKLPMQSRPADLGPTMHFSRTVNSLGFQPTHQWTPCDSWMDGSCNSPLASAQGAFHTPFLPFQSILPDKRRPYPNLVSEWLWPKIPDLPLDPRESTFAELRLRYPTTVYQYNSCPETAAPTPMFHTLLPDAEVSRFSRGPPYSYALTSHTAMSESISDGLPDSTGYLASPLVIRPTPVYPISYMHSDMHSDNRTQPPGLLL